MIRSDLGPPLAHQLHVSSGWPGYFLSALGLGTVLGSMRPTRGPKSCGKSQTSRRAAGWLLLLAVAVVVFSIGITTWVSLVAAFVAGVAALGRSLVTQTQLVRLRPRYAASVMVLWAICWAGQQADSLTRRRLARQHRPSPMDRGSVAGPPGGAAGRAEIVLPRKAKDSIRRKAKGRIRGLTVRVGLTPTPEASLLDDRQPPPKRLKPANEAGAPIVTNAPTYNGHTARQLTHRRSKVSAAKSARSPYHHQPTL